MKGYSFESKYETPYYLWVPSGVNYSGQTDFQQGFGAYDTSMPTIKGRLFLVFEPSAPDGQCLTIIHKTFHNSITPKHDTLNLGFRGLGCLGV